MTTRAAEKAAVQAQPETIIVNPFTVMCIDMVKCTLRQAGASTEFTEFSVTYPTGDVNGILEATFVGRIWAGQKENGQKMEELLQASCHFCKDDTGEWVPSYVDLNITGGVSGRLEYIYTPVIVGGVDAISETVKWTEG